MYVNSYLELHTTLIAWSLYNSIYTVLVETGILLLPVLWILVSQSLESFGREKAGSHETTIGLMRSILGALIVLALCMIPVYEVNPTTVKFRSATDMMGNTLPEVTAASDNGIFADQFGNGVSAVRIPVWWALLHAVSTGLTHAVIEAIPEHGDLRQAKQVLYSRNLEDPALGEEYLAFVNICHYPAKNNYNRMLREGLIQPAPGGADLDWAGSRFLQTLEGGYAPCRNGLACAGGPGFLSEDVVRAISSSIGLPPDANVTCTTWWQSIRSRILEQARDEEGMLDSAGNLIRGIFQSDAAVEDAMVRSTLKNFNRTQGAVSADHAENIKVGDLLNPSTYLEAAGTAVGSVGLLATWGIVEMTLGIMSRAMPILISVILLFTVVAIPLALLFTGYRIEGVVRMSFIIFSLIFLHALLSMSDWLDHHLTVSMFDDSSNWQEGVKAWLGHGDSAEGYAQKRMIINIVLAMNYMFMPMIWGYLMSAAGIKAGNALGQIGQGIGIAKAIGAENVNRMASVGTSKFKF